MSVGDLRLTKNYLANFHYTMNGANNNGIMIKCKYEAMNNTTLVTTRYRHNIENGNMHSQMSTMRGYDEVCVHSEEATQ